MKQKITLTFDLDVTDQAVVYEFIKNKGRRKTKVVTEILFKEAEKENSFWVMKEQLVKAVLEDKRIVGVLEQLGQTAESGKREEREIKKKTNLVKPRPKEDEVEDEVDVDLLMKGLDAFGAS